MGRPKDESYWNTVSKEENGRLKCKKCGLKFKGGVSRIKAHVDRIVGKGVRICSLHSPNDELHNNIISPSNNSQQHINTSTLQVAQSAGEMTDIIGASINHQTVTGSPLLGVVEEGGVEMIVGDSVNPQNHRQLTASLEIEGGSVAEHDNGVLTTLQSNLDELLSHLTSEEEDIQGQLQWQESNGMKRKREVDYWLDDLQDVKQRAIDMKNSLNQFGLSDFYEQAILGEKQQLTEERKKHERIMLLTEEMEWLREGKPLVLSNEFVGSEFEENVKNMWELLGSDQVFIIGIYGMGGVGKTFLATYMENEIKRKGTFGDVFWINVSHDFSILKLQHDIAETIGVKLSRDDERTRATILASELKTREKSVLILDDVWDYIDLEKVGIPLGVKGIKLIITSRLKHVCQQMDCLPNSMIKILPFINDEEAWELFLLKLGHHGTPAILPPEVLNIARSVVRKCDGLPLGINVMARTMKGRNGIHWWRHALYKLDELDKGDKVMEEIFTTLKQSYDNLIEKDLQKIFLYRSLLPEFVQRKNLISKLVDWGLLNGKSLEEIFDEGRVKLDKLVDHSLLVDDCISKMHGLMRKMASRIMKESQYKIMVKCDENMKKIPDIREWTIDLELISLAANQIVKIPDGTAPSCPRLSTLLLNVNIISHIPNCFFRHMNALTTLDLSYNYRLKCLPNSLSNLKSLTSLVLNGCSDLEYIPPLGELQALLRLEISECFNLRVPPERLENLINLKWLDLSNSFDLLVPRNVLSKLTDMQFLDLRNGYGIEVTDVQGMSMLECFRGSFLDQYNYNLYMQEIMQRCYGPKNYHILMGKCEDWDPDYLIDPSSLEFKPPSVWFGDCEKLSYLLPSNLKELFVTGNDQWECLCGPLLRNEPYSLKKISISNCKKLKSLFCLLGSCSFCHHIGNLESLILYDLEGLTAICKENVVDLTQLPSVIFFHLKNFYIDKCHKIETLLTPELVSQLQNVESITVSNCESMKEIFAVHNDGDDNSFNITLPKLNSFEMWNLPQLKIVSKGILVCVSEDILWIIDCPNLESRPKIQVFCG